MLTGAHLLIPPSRPARLRRPGTGNSVGSEQLQQVNGTYRDIHGCTRAAVVTTSHFTRAARQFADRVGLDLLDGPRLHAWINGRRGAAPWS